MQKMSKRLMLLAFAVLLVIGVVLIGGCGTKEPEPAQIILNLSPQQAYDLIQDNTNNVDFLIIDVRTPVEFAESHIENAIIIDYNSDIFEDRIGFLDREKIYLIYCKTGARGGNVLAIMEELGFTEVYMISGGSEAWQEDELPVVAE